VSTKAVNAAAVLYQAFRPRPARLRTGRDKGLAERFFRTAFRATEDIP